MDTPTTTIQTLWAGYKIQFQILLGLTMLFLFVWLLNLYYFNREINAIVQHFDNAYEMKCEKILKNDTIPEYFKSPIINTLKELKHYQNSNKSLLLDIYPAYHSNVVLFAILSGILTILTFFVSQKGWAQASDLTKTLFVLFAFASALFGLFPSLFDQQDNINANQITFLQNEKLQNDLFLYTTRYALIKENSADSLSLMIKKVQDASDGIINIQFNMNPEKMSADLLKFPTVSE